MASEKDASQPDVSETEGQPTLWSDEMIFKKMKLERMLCSAETALSEVEKCLSRAPVLDSEDRHIAEEWVQKVEKMKEDLRNSIETLQKVTEEMKKEKGKLWKLARAMFIAKEADMKIFVDFDESLTDYLNNI